MSEPEIIIERLAVGGNGVGRLDGVACFVPFTAPGDRLTLRVTSRKRSYLEGELSALREPSSWRTEPSCPVFGQCGGCSWQHIDYALQCRAKRALLVESLERIARLVAPPVEETVAAPHPYGYRARAQFKLFSAAERLAVGFYRRGSRYVIDLPDGCPVVTPAINTAMQRLRLVLTLLPDRNRIPQLSIEEGEEGVVAVVHYIGREPERLRALLLERQAELGLAGLWVQPGRKESLLAVFGGGRLTYLVPGGAAGEIPMPLGYDIGGFSQVNRGQNRVLVNLVRELLAVRPDERLLDIYCGNGNLSLPLAGLVTELVGVEEYPPSIASAIDNARQLRVNNSTFRCRSAVDEVERLVAVGERFAAVLLDPPRSGAAEVVCRLRPLQAERLVYVSCDPATFARDAAVLAGHGYRLERAIPVDMFPQTAHLETVALFSLS